MVLSPILVDNSGFYRDFFLLLFKTIVRELGHSNQSTIFAKTLYHLSNTHKSILLLAALMLPVLVAMSWLKIHKKMVKREVKWLILNHLQKEDLIKLQFTTSEKDALKWEHNREFECNGNMYDIVKSEISKDSFTYYCYLDHAETVLNNSIDKAIQHMVGKDAKQHQTKDELTNFLKSLYCNDLHVFGFNTIHIKTYNIILYTDLESIQVYNLLSPPPQFS